MGCTLGGVRKKFPENNEFYKNKPFVADIFCRDCVGSGYACVNNIYASKAQNYYNSEGCQGQIGYWCAECTEYKEEFDKRMHDRNIYRACDCEGGKLYTELQAVEAAWEKAEEAEDKGAVEKAEKEEARIMAKMSTFENEETERCNKCDNAGAVNNLHMYQYDCPQCNMTWVPRLIYTDEGHVNQKECRLACSCDEIIPLGF